MVGQSRSLANRVKTVASVKRSSPRTKTKTYGHHAAGVGFTGKYIFSFLLRGLTILRYRSLGLKTKKDHFYKNFAS